MNQLKCLKQLTDLKPCRRIGADWRDHTHRRVGQRRVLLLVVLLVRRKRRRRCCRLLRRRGRRGTVHVAVVWLVVALLVRVVGVVHVAVAVEAASEAGEAATQRTKAILEVGGLTARSRI